MELIKANKERAEANYDQLLVTKLDSIYNDDQIFRKRYSSVEQSFGTFSKELKALSKTIVYNDSINLVKVKAILNKYGWLGIEDIGQQGNSTLFLVIQHSDLSTQEKYLPMMREAVKQRKASPSSLALMEERGSTRAGEKTNLWKSTWTK